MTTMRFFKRTCALLLALVLFLGTGLIRPMTVQADEQTEAETEAETETETEAQTDGQTDNSNICTIYFSGIDSRAGLEEKSRSDVNIIAVMNLDTSQILLISTPRDFFVPLSISNGVPDKLTHAGIYGVQCSMDTLGMLYDIDVDYHFRASFDGITDMVNALGGVTAYSEYTFDAGGYHFEEGYNDMDGAAALAFCRERYAFASGDRQRGRHQMHMINAIIHKIATPEGIKAIPDILFGETSQYYDTDISYSVLFRLLMKEIFGQAKWNITQYSVDGYGDTQVPYSMSQAAYVMVPDQSTVDHAKELIRQVVNGEAPQV